MSKLVRATVPMCPDHLIRTGPEDSEHNVFCPECGDFIPIVWGYYADDALREVVRAVVDENDWGRWPEYRKRLLAALADKAEEDPNESR